MQLLGVFKVLSMSSWSSTCHCYAEAPCEKVEKKLAATAASQHLPLADRLANHVGLEHLPVGIGPIVAALIGMDQKLVEFDLAEAKVTF